MEEEIGGLYLNTRSAFGLLLVPLSGFMTGFPLRAGLNFACCRHALHAPCHVTPSLALQQMAIVSGLVWKQASTLFL